MHARAHDRKTVAPKVQIIASNQGLLTKKTLAPKVQVIASNQGVLTKNPKLQNRKLTAPIAETAAAAAAKGPPIEGPPIEGPPIEVQI